VQDLPFELEFKGWVFESPQFSIEQMERKSIEIGFGNVERG
jgi:hypothetical protein